MPDMIFYRTNFTTCVVKPQCLPSVYANPTFTCVPVSQGNELPVDHLLLLHSPHRLQTLLRCEGMSAALAFGDPVVRRYLISESPTPMPSHTYQLKSPRSLNARKRRRRVLHIPKQSNFSLFGIYPKQSGRYPKLVRHHYQCHGIRRSSLRRYGSCEEEEEGA